MVVMRETIQLESFQQSDFTLSLERSCLLTQMGIALSYFQRSDFTLSRGRDSIIQKRSTSGGFQRSDLTLSLEEVVPSKDKKELAVSNEAT